MIMKKKIDVYEHMGEILKGVKSGVLVTGKADDRVNSMTISWGMVGIEWAKTCICNLHHEKAASPEASSRKKVNSPLTFR